MQFKVGDKVRLRPRKETELDAEDYQAMKKDFATEGDVLTVFEINTMATFPYRLRDSHGPIFKDYEIILAKTIIRQLEV